MGINNKYNVKERIIVRRINDLKIRQAYLRKRYIDIDIKISALQTSFLDETNNFEKLNNFRNKKKKGKQNG